MDAAIHAAELQLPESWSPFVVSREQAVVNVSMASVAL